MEDSLSESVSKFKVGDKVKVVRYHEDSESAAKRYLDKYEVYLGGIVELVEIHSMTLYATYKGKKVILDPTEVELCKYKNTRLAKKMYPKARVSECGEWIYV